MAIVTNVSIATLIEVPLPHTIATESLLGHTEALLLRTGQCAQPLCRLSFAYLSDKFAFL